MSVVAFIDCFFGTTSGEGETEDGEVEGMVEVDDSAGVIDGASLIIKAPITLNSPVTRAAATTAAAPDARNHGWIARLLGCGALLVYGVLFTMGSLNRATERPPSGDARQQSRA
jgi:hypothetical protein